MAQFRPFLRTLVLALATLGTACGSDTDPRPATWSYLSPAIMEPNCATVSCHSPAAAVSGLDFSTQERGYTSLLGLWTWIVDPSGNLAQGCKSAAGTVVCPREHRSLVVPFDPAQSRLIHVLRAQGAARMPPDRPLAEADIRLVETWILNGARRGIAGAPAPLAGPVDGSATDATPMDAAIDTADAGSSDAADAGSADAGGAEGGAGKPDVLPAQ